MNGSTLRMNHDADAVVELATHDVPDFLETLLSKQNYCVTGYHFDCHMCIANVCSLTSQVSKICSQLGLYGVSHGTMDA